MFYLIRESLEACEASAIRDGDIPYVAAVTKAEWREHKDLFGMGMDMEAEPMAAAVTRAWVNYDSLTGSIVLPQKGLTGADEYRFAFALDERGIVFIDDGGRIDDVLVFIASTKKWRMPSLERFLYDFLEQIIDGDLAMLDQMEQTLDKMEERILADASEEDFAWLNHIRGNLLDLRLHYGQLMDLGVELEENENGFFREENLRYFRLFTARVSRLQETVTALRDYTVQLRDLIQTRIDVKQNKIITLLTVITTIFTPLTLLTGWYGMNFRYMPELEYRASYPIVIAVSLAIAIGCLVYFKKKKWL
jgi:magnesium transporter